MDARSGAGSSCAPPSKPFLSGTPTARSVDIIAQRERGSRTVAVAVA
jgi:hypothetical protein